MDAPPCNAVLGRQLACLPELENMDFPKGAKDTSADRGIRIHQTSIGAITQSQAASKVKGSLRAKTTLDGDVLYKPGDLLDYHRPPN